MKVKGHVIFTLATAVLLTGFAFYTASILPPGAELPTHWNAAGQVDDTSPALIALLIPAGIVLLMGLLLAIIPAIEPLQDRLEGSAPLLRATWGAVVLLAVLIAAVIGLPAYGIHVPVNAIMLGIGMVLVIVGNALPKSRPGFFVGIRTPWTITNTDNWIATHRLGGKLMILAGAAIILASLLPLTPETTAIVVLTTVAMAVIVPFAYSWWLWHRSRGHSAE